jgi:hypothetical protein
MEVVVIKVNAYKQKTWSQFCTRFHDVKVFALPCPSKPSNAESPTPMYIV